MADRNSDHRSDRRPRWNSQQGERDQSGWQQEQFESGRGGWNNTDGQGQMGDSGWLNDSDANRQNDRSRSQYGYGRSAGANRPSDFDARGYQDQGRTYGSYTGRSQIPTSSYTGSTFTGDDFGGRDFSGQAGDWSGRSNFGGYGAGSTSGAYTGDRYDSHRGFLERAGDEVASWFGDKEAARRREEDHSGKGPSNYTRSDQRILEDVSDRITDDWRVDGRNIQVTVDSGEVTLDGTVTSRDQKRRAEDCADAISGVKHVQNNLRVDTSSTGTDTAADATSRPAPFI